MELEKIIEARGNKGYNYIKLGSKNNSNLLYLEVGHCGVSVFKGFVTVELITGFLTQSHFDANKPLHLAMKDNMGWEEDVNERLFEGSKVGKEDVWERSEREFYQDAIKQANVEFLKMAFEAGFQVGEKMDFDDWYLGFLDEYDIF